MKQKLPFILVFLLLAVGLCALLYPAVSNFICTQTASAQIASYKKSVSNLSINQQKVALAAARAYNKSLSGVVIKDPFSNKNTVDKSGRHTKYMHLLNVDGIMGYVDIPSIKVYLPIYHGTSQKVLLNGAGHLEGSSLPVGGKGTHTVITAHRGLPSAKLFTDLDQLEIGDMFYLHVLGETLAYRIDQIKVVVPTNVKPLAVVPGKDYATLMTCTPYGINSHRMMVRGVRTANVNMGNGDLPLGGGQNLKNEILSPPIWLVILAGFVLFIPVRIAVRHVRKRSKKKTVKEVAGS